MNSTACAKPPISTEESKVLFALLDAAEEAGRLASAFVQERWSEAKARLIDSPYATESALLWELLEEVEKSGAINNTWIGDRWSTIKRQVERTAALIESSSGASPSHTPPFFARDFR